MKFDTYLKYIIYTALFAVPFIPLIIAPSLFFPFITGKNFLFRMLVEVMAGGWIILMLREPAFRPRFSGILAAIGAFLAILFIADLFSPNSFKSFWSNFERMEGFVTFVHLALYFVVAAAMLRSEKLWERFFATSIGASTLVSLYGLLQLMGVAKIQQGGARVDASFGNASYLAIYMLFHIFFLLWFMRRNLNVAWIKWGAAVFILLDFVILYYTATRGAIFGILGALLATSLLIAVFEREQKGLRKIAIGAIVAVFVIVAGFFAIRDTAFVQNSPVLSRFDQISLSTSTTLSRFTIWNIALEGFKERPILGWGQESFNYVFNANYNPAIYNQEQWFDRTHNVFLDWLIAGGILGLIAYLSIFGMTLWYLWRPRVDLNFAERAIFTGMLLGYFFHNLFVFDNITSYIVYFSILAYIHYKAGGRQLFAGNIDKGTVNRLVTPTVAVLVVFALFFVNIRPLMASSALIKGFKSQPEGVQANYNYFDKALSYNFIGNAEIREQLAQVTMQVATLPDNAASPEIRQRFIERTIAELKAQLEETPNDARYQLFLGSFLSSTFLGRDRNSEALVYLQKANDLSPQKPSILFEIGNAHIGLGEYDKALAVFKQVYELVPEYDEAILNYAMAAAYSKDLKLVSEILTPRYGTAYIADDRFIRAYFDTKQYVPLTRVWEAKVAESPQNAQFRLSLAASYAEIGERQKAIAELREVIRLQPDFKTQAEFYIKEIQAGRKP